MQEEERQSTVKGLRLLQGLKVYDGVCYCFLCFGGTSISENCFRKEAFPIFRPKFRPKGIISGSK